MAPVAGLFHGTTPPYRLRFAPRKSPQNGPRRGGTPENVEGGSGRRPAPGDRVAYTTCYMCACRCGIKVHLKDGGIRYIEGNRDHPVNQGVLCAKGSAGIMQHYSPARLRKPLRRVGPRGSGEFREIEWDEALATATEWLGTIRDQRPAQARLLHRPRPEPGADRLVGEPVRHAQLRGPWRLLLGQHGGGRALHASAARSGSSASPTGTTRAISCCSASPRIMIPTRSRSASASCKARGAKIVSVNPVRTGYSAIADEWLGIRPGTDGLFVFALIHELLRAGQIDLDYPRPLHQRGLAGDPQPRRGR